MKLRNLIALGAVGMASAAFATGTLTSANTFGILALADTTSTNLIISVPWVDCAAATQGTFVSNVVKTTNLSENDYIIRKSGNTYQGWKLQKASNNVLYWAPAIITDGTVTTTTEGADTARMARGDALWLHRSNPATSSPIYLFGQYSTAAATTTIAAGSTTLVANPGTTALSPNSFNWTSGQPATGDKILVNVPGGYRTYTYNGTKWTYLVKTTSGSAMTLPKKKGQTTAQTTYNVTETETDAVAIPAGVGFWYQAGTGAGVIGW